MTELDEKIGEFAGKLLVSVVGKEMTVPQAVQEIDIFMSRIQGRLPADEWATVKSGLLSNVFSLERNMLAQDDSLQGTPAREETSDSESHVINIREVNPVWEQIKAQLPEHMVDTPEKCNKTAWQIGFLLGLGGETVVAKVLRRLWKLP